MRYRQDIYMFKAAQSFEESYSVWIQNTYLGLSQTFENNCANKKYDGQHGRTPSVVNVFAEIG